MKKLVSITQFEHTELTPEQITAILALDWYIEETNKEILADYESLIPVFASEDLDFVEVLTLSDYSLTKDTHRFSLEEGFYRESKISIYRREAEYLKDTPEKIISHWEDASPLFAFLGPRYSQSHHRCGCLTQIKIDNELDRTVTSPNGREDKEMYNQIKDDPRVPCSQHEVEHLVIDGEPEVLDVFVEYQELYDSKYGPRDHGRWESQF